MLPHGPQVLLHSLTISRWLVSVRGLVVMSGVLGPAISTLPHTFAGDLTQADVG
jgi:hypothetical protein